MKAIPTILFGTVLLTTQLHAGYVTKLHDFGTPLGNIGIYPHASVIAGPDGTFYGTTTQGGPYNDGVVYSLQTNGLSFPLWNFTGGADGVFPSSELVLSSNTLYGTTEGHDAGTSFGTVFKVNTDGTGFVTLYTFTNGVDGSAPMAGLVLSGNVLYGVATGGGASLMGTIYKVNTDGTGFAALKNFSALDPNTETNADGAEPQGTLLLAGNTLYGTATEGGAYHDGTVFAIQTNGSGFQVLHSFDLTNGAYPFAGLIMSGGALFGTTDDGNASDGTIFRLNPDGSEFTNLYNLPGDGSEGANPTCRLAVVGNTLYGTAGYGGANGNGGIFSIGADGTDFSLLYSFTALDPNNGNNYDGANPYAGLYLYNGALYGTASAGGYDAAVLGGTIFQINPDGSGFQPDYYFDDVSYYIDGSYPQCALTVGGNSLYGVTPTGGLYSDGSVFKMNSDGSGFESLHSFSYADGENPYGTLVLVGNTLYGTAASGGLYNNGVIFSINTDGTGFTNLYAFTGGNDGGSPVAGLVLQSNVLYGSAQDGSSNHLGSIFAINLDGSGFMALHAFDNSDGANPGSPLCVGGSTLYGESYSGGNGLGTLYKLQTDGSGFSLLRVFSFISGEGSAGEGQNPDGGMILSGSTLYGVTYAGGENHTGNVFKISTNGTGYATLFNFDSSSSSYPPNVNTYGANPIGGLLLAGGSLYGATSQGGSAGFGTLYAVNTNANGSTGATNIYTFTDERNAGAVPYGALTLYGASLFGTTDTGGTYYDGTVFSYDLVPPMQLTQVGNSPVVYWQSDGQNHTLQLTTNLSAGIWTNAPTLNWTNSPFIGLQITNPSTPPAAFFRLKL